MKPVIGILSEVMIEKEGKFLGEEKDYVTVNYVKSIANAGGIPVILPVVDDEFTVAQLGSVDGLLISGGFDVNPLIYGEEPHKDIGFVRPDRDMHDICAIRTAYKMGKPILGICKGIQILNVAFHGTLYQDISEIKGSYIAHSQNAKPEIPTHTVEIKRGSILHKLIGNTAYVNSFHHESVKDVAEGFDITAMSKDGVIEAIEKTGSRFVVGVQWHPEMMSHVDEDSMKIFKAFIEATKNSDIR